MRINQRIGTIALTSLTQPSLQLDARRQCIPTHHLEATRRLHTPSTRQSAVILNSVQYTHLRWIQQQNPRRPMDAPNLPVKLASLLLVLVHLI